MVTSPALGVRRSLNQCQSASVSVYRPSAGVARTIHHGRWLTVRPSITFVGATWHCETVQV